MTRQTCGDAFIGIFVIGLRTRILAIDPAMSPLTEQHHNTDPADSSHLTNLRTELTRLMLAGMVALLLAAWLLSTQTGAINALLYLLASTALWLLVWQQSHSRLALNRGDQASPLYAALGWANRMTISRGWLTAATGGFLLLPDVLDSQPWLLWAAAALYSLAAILDRADGFVARRTGQTTLLGARLDTVFDALGLLVAPLLALQHGKIHASYLLVSIAYYLFVLGIRMREQRQRPVYPLPPSLLRRSLAGFQMGYVAVVLWPPFKAEVTVPAGFGFMVPLLIGFLVDWLVVSGRLTSQHGVSAWFRYLHHISQQWLLPALRVALVLTAVLVASHLHPVVPWPPLVNGLLAIGAAMMALGLAGRAGAIMVLMLLAWAVPLPVMSVPFVICLVIITAILLLGCGRFSLWQADDDWVNRQDGA